VLQLAEDIAYLKEECANKPKNAVVHTQLGDALEEAGDIEVRTAIRIRAQCNPSPCDPLQGAAAAYIMSLSIKPTYAKAQKNLAQLNQTHSTEFAFDPSAHVAPAKPAAKEAPAAGSEEEEKLRKFNLMMDEGTTERLGAGSEDDSEEKALVFKSAGNGHFSKQEFKDAVKEYTSAIQMLEVPRAAQL
jgi:hypothetical protein